jgi:hypothetical protein
VSKGHEAIERLYGELPQLKRVELSECFVEGLLLEVDLDEVRLLGELPALATHHEFARLAEALKDRSQSKRTSFVVLFEMFLRFHSPKW